LVILGPVAKSDAEQVTELSGFLNRWDPIGVADEVDGEYDCMVPNLRSLLMAGASHSDFKSYLWQHLRDHFGLEPSYLDVDRVSRDLEAMALRWAKRDGQR
jgi:hypothetical protein